MKSVIVLEYIAKHKYFFLVYFCIYSVLELLHNLYIDNNLILYAVRLVKAYFVIIYLNVSKGILTNNVQLSVKAMLSKFDKKIAMYLLINIVLLYLAIFVLAVPVLLYFYIKTKYGLNLLNGYALFDGNLILIVFKSAMTALSWVSLSFILSVSGNKTLIINFTKKQIKDMLQSKYSDIACIMIYIIIVNLVKHISTHKMMGLFLDSLAFISVPLLAFSLMHYMLQENSHS
jgi:hypothetical protein